MIGPTCGTCGHIHVAADATVAGSRFDPRGPFGYVAKSGGPVRATRAEAMADNCRAVASRRQARA